MGMVGATTFGEAIARAPMRAFQWVTVIVCMLVLVSDGVDMQLLGIVAPLVVHDLGVDKGTFGIAMGAALVGFGLGAWSGGRLGDAIGRRFALAIAALIFSLATVGASQAGGVWPLALWRAVGGLGFGAAYANALAMASEWLPERYRPVAVSSLSVGTPLGGTVAGWLAPGLAAEHGWRGAFVVFGLVTSLLVVIVLVALRDSPSFLMARGKKEKAEQAARRVITGQVALASDPVEESVGAVGVLHRSNLRLNIGIGVGFAATALVAYGILNWSTTFLTAAGFTLSEAAHAVAIAGITSMVGSIAAGMLCRRFGSRRVVAWLSGILLILIVALAATVEALPAAPTAAERLPAVVLIGAAAMVFSASMATMYVIMALGYQQACRSAGIGFGIFMSRVGAISASGFGGALLELGTPVFFAVLAVCAVLISSAAFIVDRHVPAGR